MSVGYAQGGVSIDVPTLRTGGVSIKVPTIARGGGVSINELRSAQGVFHINEPSIDKSER